MPRQFVRRHFLAPLPGIEFFLSLVLATFSNLQIFFCHSLASHKGSLSLASFHLFIFFRLIFRHITNHFIIISLAPGHFGWLLVWVATSLIHLFTPRQESPLISICYLSIISSVLELVSCSSGDSNSFISYKSSC